MPQNANHDNTDIKQPMPCDSSDETKLLKLTSVPYHTHKDVHDHTDEQYTLNDSDFIIASALDSSNSQSGLTESVPSPQGNNAIPVLVENESVSLSLEARHLGGDQSTRLGDSGFAGELSVSSQNEGSQQDSSDVFKEDAVDDITSHAGVNSLQNNESLFNNKSLPDNMLTNDVMQDNKCMDADVIQENECLVNINVIEVDPPVSNNNVIQDNQPLSNNVAIDDNQYSSMRENNQGSSGAMENNQGSSCAMENNQGSSCVVENNQGSSCVVENNQGSSCVVETNQGSSCVVENNQGSSCAMENNQRSSITSGNNQCSSSSIEEHREQPATLIDNNEFINRNNNYEEDQVEQTWSIFSYFYNAYNRVRRVLGGHTHPDAGHASLPIQDNSGTPV
jgi:hypothetical protein